MVMLPTTAQGRVFKFHSASLPENTLLIGAMEGVDAISRPYRFELLLLSQKVDLNSTEILKAPAFVEFKKGFRAKGGDGLTILRMRLNGMLAEFEQSSKGPMWVVYRALFVPRLWKLSLDVQTRIFMNESVVEIVTKILKKSGFEEEAAEPPGAAPGDEVVENLTIDGPRFRFALDPTKYPKREYVVQYQESDLDFVSRLLEHEGICYFFDQKDGHETVVFGDSPSAHSMIFGADALPYRPAAGSETALQGAGGISGWYPEERISELACRHKTVQKGVVLQDYNWREPNAPLKAEAAVAPGGDGVFYEYGDHYKNQEEGKGLAKIRAQEIRCREKQFVGKSDCRSLQAGFLYLLEEHYRPDFNGTYLITEVRHRAEQVIPQKDGRVASLAYRNEFVSMPTRDENKEPIVFRPQRLTPKPKIPGTINAIVDATGDGKYAEINEGGHYKVKIPFDLSDRGGGQASRYVRMAQPYAGTGMGLHFPLHKGTEVLLTHVNGDPDRPLIAGAVPNPATLSPVVGANSTQGIVKSPANNAFVFEDLEGEECVFLRARKDHEIRVEHDARERIGHDRHLIVGRNQVEHVRNDRHEKIDRDHVVEVGGSVHRTVNAHESVDIGGQQSVTVQGDLVREVLADHSEKTTGVHSVSAEGGIVLESPAGITLKCGESTVVIDASGVTVAGPVLTLDGTQAKINSGPGSEPAAAAEHTLKSPKAPAKPLEPRDLEVSTATHAGGSGGEESGASGAEGESTWISIELKDDEGQPVAHEPYRITFANGRVMRGRLGKDGTARVEGVPAGEAKISFPRQERESWTKG